MTAHEEEVERVVGTRSVGIVGGERDLIFGRDQAHHDLLAMTARRFCAKYHQIKLRPRHCR